MVSSTTKLSKSKTKKNKTNLKKSNLKVKKTGRSTVKKDKHSKVGNSTKGSNAGSEVNEALERRRRFVPDMGLKISNYKRFFVGCKGIESKKEKLIAYMQYIMHENDLKGVTTIEMCSMTKAKKDEEEEVAEMNPGNIISKSGRGQRNVCEKPKVKLISSPAKKKKEKTESESDSYDDSESESESADTGNDSSFVESSESDSSSAEKRRSKKGVLIHDGLILSSYNDYQSYSSSDGSQSDSNSAPASKKVTKLSKRKTKVNAKQKKRINDSDGDQSDSDLDSASKGKTKVVVH